MILFYNGTKSGKLLKLHLKGDPSTPHVRRVINRKAEVDPPQGDLNPPRSTDTLTWF